MLEWNFYLDAKTPGPSGVTETAPVSCHQRQSLNWITQGGGSSDERRFAYLISFTFSPLSAWGCSLPTKWNPRTPPPRKQRQHMQQRQLNAKSLIPGLQGWHHPTPLPQRQTQLAKIPALEWVAEFLASSPTRSRRAMRLGDDFYTLRFCMEAVRCVMLLSYT